MNLQFFFFAFQFASNGNEEEVEKLLSSGGDHGSPGEKFCHPLCSCAKCEKLHTRYTLWLQLSVFTNVASIYTNLLEQMKRFTWKKKKKKKTGLVWNTNMRATVSLFWNTNMAAVTSRENALKVISELP